MAGLDISDQVGSDRWRYRRIHNARVRVRWTPDQGENEYQADRIRRRVVRHDRLERCRDFDAFRQAATRFTQSGARLPLDSPTEISLRSEFNYVLKCVDSDKKGLRALGQNTVDRRDERYAKMSPNLSVALSNLLVCCCFGNTKFVYRHGSPHALMLQGKKVEVVDVGPRRSGIPNPRSISDDTHNRRCH